MPDNCSIATESPPPPYLLDAVESAIGKKTTRWKMPEFGLSAALRYSVEFEDDSRVFVKAATNEETAAWLRTEHVALSTVRREFMPHVIDWIDGAGSFPILITQDLSHARWPTGHGGVIWREGDVDLLFDGIRTLSSLRAPAELPVLHNRKTAIWPRIASNPDMLLTLGFCTGRWLADSTDTLVAAETNLDVMGDYLVHGDVRSDNICFLGAQVIWVDWSHSARGSGRHDLATLLPTLHLEGGPPPYMIMPDGGGEAAAGCALHIYRLAADTGMPGWLQHVFRQLIAIELEWAAQCLGLAAPDGARWRHL